MKIKKNGKVINLTESDLKRIVKKTLNEQSRHNALRSAIRKLDEFDPTEAMMIILKDLNSDIDLGKIMKSIPEFNDIKTQMEKGILALKREIEPSATMDDMKKGMEKLGDSIRNMTIDK
jgi:hypothetical protein